MVVIDTEPNLGDRANSVGRLENLRMLVVHNVKK